MVKTFSVSNYLYQRAGSLKSNFSLKVPALVLQGGVVTSLVGPSGSGKTTLFDLFAGVIPQTVGDRLRQVFPKVAYIMHETSLMPWKTGLKNYLLECRLRRETSNSTRFARLVVRCGLDEDVLRTPVRQLSFGMRQRLELARALAFEPDLLILDEGLSGLNRELKIIVFGIVLEQVFRRDMAVLLTSHFLTDVLTFSNRIYRIRDGTVLEAPIEIAGPLIDRLQLSEGELFRHEEVSSALAVLS
jgi:NitT/TauT family transport system ATP-binding protein